MSKRDLAVDHERDLVVANSTRDTRTFLLQIRFLKPGSYAVRIAEGRTILKSAAELAEGLALAVPANSTLPIQVKAVSLTPPGHFGDLYDESVTFLSDLQELGSQRGIGFPSPVFRRDASFRGSPLRVEGREYRKGLGLAADTVIVYSLQGEFHRLAATLGVAEDGVAEDGVAEDSVAKAPGPPGPPSAAQVTILADERPAFSSGVVMPVSGALDIDVDVRHTKVLVIRISSNWDYGGNLQNGMVKLANARFIGRTVSA